MYSLVAACATLQPLQAVFVQPTLILSLGLSFETHVPALSTTTHHQTRV